MRDTSQDWTPPGKPDPRTATAAGLGAILLWSGLAALTVVAAGIPPFQLVAMSFAVASVIGVLFLAANKSARRSLRSIPATAVLLGVAGLFGYHFFYFLGLSLAPSVEANLVNYLWPLLIVLFSGLLPDQSEKLGWRHVAGAAAGFTGAAVLILNRGSLSFQANALFGYLAVLAAAFVWSSYSVLSRLLARVPSTAVALYCAITAAAALAAHKAFETSTWPLAYQQWLAVLALGTGPVGLAFYIWDYGCKHGDIRLLGVSAYFAPLLSTALLAASGLAETGPVIWVAALLITGGAVLAMPRR